MEWKENPQLADRMLGLIAEDMKLDKPLPHVTELIYCLTKAWNDRFDPVPLTPKEICLFSIGVKLGEVLLSPHAQEVEGVLDGIHYSVDFMTDDGGTKETEVIGELKSTRMSMKKHPDDFPMGYRKQLLAYMKGADCLEAVYGVMYVIPAEFKMWEVLATQEEVDENWVWLQERKETYMSYVADKVRPIPYAYNEDWECKNCRYELACPVWSAQAKGQ